MHSPSTHESLLERLAATEDQDAWRLFCERYGALIRDFGRRRGLQPSDCDDLLQDVLVALTRSMPGFRYDPAKGRLRSYLKTVTQRAISRKTRQKRGEASLDPVEDDLAADEAETWEEAWRQYHVRRALRRLRKEFPESTLAAFDLYVLDGRSPDETSSMLGISIDSVYQAKSRVLRRVSKLVAEQVAEEG